MSTVFGILKVKEVKKSTNERFPFTLICIDPDLDEKVEIGSRKLLKEGAILYWEENLVTGETRLDEYKQALGLVRQVGFYILLGLHGKTGEGQQPISQQ